MALGLLGTIAVALAAWNLQPRPTERSGWDPGLYRYLEKELGAEVLESPEALAKVESLEIPNISLESSADFRRFRNLRALTVTRQGYFDECTSDPTDVDYTPLQVLKQLEELDLCVEDPRQLPHVASVKRLRIEALSLGGYRETWRRFGLDPVQHIAVMTQLEELTLANTSIEDRELAILADSLPNLKSLTIVTSEVTDVAPLLRLPNLRRFELDNRHRYNWDNRPDPAGLDALRAKGVEVVYAPLSQPPPPGGESVESN